MDFRGRGKPEIGVGVTEGDPPQGHDAAGQFVPGEEGPSWVTAKRDEPEGKEANHWIGCQRSGEQKGMVWQQGECGEQGGCGVLAAQGLEDGQGELVGFPGAGLVLSRGRELQPWARPSALSAIRAAFSSSSGGASRSPGSSSCRAGASLGSRCAADASGTRCQAQSRPGDAAAAGDGSTRR